MQLKENTMFANRYQLERLLGRGGFSEVWLAKDSYTKLNIAIKVYAPGQGMDSDGLQEFSQELAGVFNLNQTNLLKPTHVDSWEGMPYLIMAYCSQGSLTKRIGKMLEQDIWHVIHDVAAGLAYLHKNDIVHQDIKPDNILIDEAGNYVITDFGISTKARSTLRKSVIGGSLSGGTMAYMGPERFSRQPAPTKASDIWSFGAMVFELITGNVPFGEMGGGMQKGGAEIPDISEDVSNALKGTIEQMLALDTWDRPTAEKLVEIAKTHFNDAPIVSQPQITKPQEPTSGRETQLFTSSASQTPANLSITETDIIAPADGSQCPPIEISSNRGWEVTKSVVTAGWLHYKKDTQHSIVVWCDKNKTGETRTTQIYVNSGEEQKTIRVAQTSLPKSYAWIWWLIVVGALSFGILGVRSCQIKEAERQERARIEQQRQVQERQKKEQADAKKKSTATTLTVSSSIINAPADGTRTAITVNSNTSWHIEYPVANIYSTTRYGNTITVEVNENRSSETRSDFFNISTDDGKKTQKVTITQRGKVSTASGVQTNSNSTSTTFVPKTVQIDSKIKRTDAHLWKILRIELTASKTILYERVTPTEENTAVWTTGDEYIQDVQTGQKYYLKYSDLGTRSNPKMLYTDAPLSYTCTYPPLPMSVKRINIWDGSEYVVKNLQIR